MKDSDRCIASNLSHFSCLIHVKQLKSEVDQSGKTSSALACAATSPQLLSSLR